MVEIDMWQYLMKLALLGKRIDVDWLIQTGCLVLNLMVPYLSNFEMSIPPSCLGLGICLGGVCLMLSQMFLLATWVATLTKFIDAAALSTKKNFFLHLQGKNMKKHKGSYWIFHLKWPPKRGINWNGNCQRSTAWRRCHNRSVAKNGVATSVLVGRRGGQGRRTVKFKVPHWWDMFMNVGTPCDPQILMFFSRFVSEALIFVCKIQVSLKSMTRAWGLVSAFSTFDTDYV